MPYGILFLRGILHIPSKKLFTDIVVSSNLKVCEMSGLLQEIKAEDS